MSIFNLRMPSTTCSFPLTRISLSVLLSSHVTTRLPISRLPSPSSIPTPLTLTAGRAERVHSTNHSQGQVATQSAGTSPKSSFFFRSLAILLSTDAGFTTTYLIYNFVGALSSEWWDCERQRALALRVEKSRALLIQQHSLRSFAQLSGNYIDSRS